MRTIKLAYVKNFKQNNSKKDSCGKIQKLRNKNAITLSQKSQPSSSPCLRKYLHGYVHVLNRGSNNMFIEFPNKPIQKHA